MRIPEFTAAEQRVVRLISLGLSTKQVAKVLGKAVSTIDNQRTSAMRAAEITTATQLVRVALLSRVTTLEDELTEEEQQLANSTASRSARKANKAKQSKGKKSASSKKSKKAKGKKRVNRSKKKSRKRSR